MSVITLPVWLVKFFMTTPYGYTSLTLYQNGARAINNVFSSAISLAGNIDNLSTCKVSAISVRREVYRVNEKQPEAGSNAAIVGLFLDGQYTGPDYQTARVPGLKLEYQNGYPPFNYGEVDTLALPIAQFLALLNSSFNRNRLGEQLTYDAGSFILDAVGITGKDLPGT